MRKCFLILQVLFVISFAGACNDDDNNESEKVDSITITNKDDTGGITVEKGKTFQVETSISPLHASKALVYEANYTNVFTVSDRGIITGLADGEAMLTVRSQENLEVAASCKISVFTVPIPTESFAFPDAVEGMIEIIMEQSKKVNVEFLPAGVTNRSISFESEDTKIFTVDEEGNITGVKEGQAKLIVKALDGSNTVGSCTIKVNRILVGDIKAGRMAMLVGDTWNVSPTVKIKPENATIKEVEFISSDPSIVTVDENGLVTAKAIGETTVIVKAKDGSEIAGEATVLVGREYVPVDRSGFKVGCSDEELNAGGDNGGAKAILNDLNGSGNYWHSLWSDGTGQLPHWFIITMDDEKTLSKILLARREDNNTKDTRRVIIEGSKDNAVYTELGIIDFGDSSDIERSIEFYPTEMKYIKLTIDQSNREPFANLAIFRPYVIEK